MVATAFDALSDTELALEGLQTQDHRNRQRAGADGDAAGDQPAADDDAAPARARSAGSSSGSARRSARSRTSSADNERYFERVYEQLNRVVDGIDAAADSMAQLMDLRMNETMYWLTVVATIFLPLTFLTGFFGMNFGWMVGEIDTEVAFLMLGVGGSVVADDPDLHRDQAPRHPGRARPGRGRAAAGQTAPPAGLTRSVAGRRCRYMPSCAGA